MSGQRIVRSVVSPLWHVMARRSSPDWVSTLCGRMIRVGEEAPREHAELMHSRNFCSWCRKAEESS